MPYAIRVKEDSDYTTPWKFEITFVSFDEYNKVAQLCVSGKTIRSFDIQMLGKFRTDNWKNFSRDFFFPMVSTDYEKVNGCALKIFFLIGAIILDLLRGCQEITFRAA